MDRLYWNIEIIIKKDKTSRKNLLSLQENKIEETWSTQMDQVKAVCDPKDLICHIETETDSHFFIASIPLNNQSKKKNKMKQHFMVFGYTNSRNIDDYFKLVKIELKKKNIKIQRKPNLKFFCKDIFPSYLDMTCKKIMNFTNKRFIRINLILLFVAIIICIVVSIKKSSLETLSFGTIITIIMSLIIEIFTHESDIMLKTESLLKLITYDYNETSDIIDYKIPKINKKEVE